MKHVVWILAVILSRAEYVKTWHCFIKADLQGNLDFFYIPGILLIKLQLGTDRNCLQYIIETDSRYIQNSIYITLLFFENIIWS